MIGENNSHERFEREMIQSYKQGVNGFFKDKTKIHFKLKNGIWGNGFITRVSDEFFIVDDDRVGEQTIFYGQIRSLNVNVDKVTELMSRRGQEGLKRGILSYKDHRELGVTFKIIRIKLSEEMQSKEIKDLIKVVEAFQSSFQKMLENDYKDLEGVDTNNIYLEGGTNG